VLDRLATRIAIAFVAIGLVTLIGVGAGLFVALHDLHAEAARSALGDVLQPLTFDLAPDPDLTVRERLQRLVDDLQARVSEVGATVHLVSAQGDVFGPAGIVAVADLPLARLTDNRTVIDGSFTTPDGDERLYAARRVGGAARRVVVVLSAPDRSGGAALRDLTRTLPFLVLVLMAAGVPIAWLLSRSVTRPLRRLADATADVPLAGAAPLPLEGPTEVRELTARFNAMTEELADTRRGEQELLADLRHDIRTPLTVIAGYAGALADGTASGEDARRAAAAIGEETARLERLVEELDVIERLGSGAVELRPEQIDANELIAAAIERFRPTAAPDGVEVGRVSAGSAAARLTLTADRGAVERILANLVANALAAAPRPGGHVWLDARPTAMADGGTAVALSVADDGPGFPPGAGDRVFERFYRADPARTAGGSGLGLAIVRDLARAHGGTAHAENLAPRGARVSVVLPVVPTLPDAT
jgi:signal transduction histidine kinase